MKRIFDKRLWPGLFACAPLALLIPELRHMLESRMALHMLVEFSLLFFSGYFASVWVGRIRLRMSDFDYLGIAGLTMASCVFAFWMIPSALDAALLYPSVAAMKYASWWLAGLWIAGSIRRAKPEVLLFFLGNAVWMSATAGLLYLEATSRLCVSYLISDQIAVGWGLLVLACVFLAAIVRCADAWERRPAQTRMPHCVSDGTVTE